jgi:AcrR family transcriptional regulator
VGEGVTTDAPGTGPATKKDGRQARWARHNEQRRQQIVSAAVELIGESEPGAEVHVQQIAERAGVNRTVVYRYFTERADLDLAIQQAIIDHLWERLMPAVSLEGTVPEMIDRIVGTYVDWAAAHPSLHQAVDRDHGGGAVLEQAIDDLAADITQVISFLLAGVGTGVALDTDELDALVHGVIGAVFGAVRRWLHRPNRVLSPERLRDMMSQSAWFLVEGNARSIGVVIDPDRSIAEMIGPITIPAPADGDASGRLATVAP